MTPADLAALAAAGLTRYAEGRLAEIGSLHVLVRGVEFCLTMSGDDTPLPDLDDAVSRLKRELRR